MNTEQIEKLNQLHADLDAAVTEFVKFMVEQPIKVECHVQLSGSDRLLWFARHTDTGWGVFFQHGGRPLREVSPEAKAMSLRHAELLYLELQKQIVVLRPEIEGAIGTWKTFRDAVKQP
jgi:hypothetical protein